LFLTRNWQQEGNSSHTTLELLALHKQTGQTLCEAKSPSAYSGFHSLVVRGSEPSLELQSFNLRLRLSPVAR
jgi:hypothetical protein